MDSSKSAIFDKVVFIGPDSRGQGGISSVLASYSRHFTPFHILSTNSRKGHFIGYLQTIKAFLTLPVERAKGRKIAHIHYASGKSFFRKKMIMFWAKMLGFKIVMHCHAANGKAYFKASGVEKIRRILNKADANAVLSEHWKDFFEKELRCANVTIVNNIIGRHSKTSRTDKTNTTTFLFLGKIDNHKGVFDLVEACKRLKTKALNFKVIIGGNGKNEQLVDLLTSHKLDDIVEFRGWMDTEAKYKAFSESDVLILPSYMEGLPISILEAMEQEKGVIATPVGGVPEIIRHDFNGIIVSPGNIDEIESAIARYINEPTLAKQHGENSRNIVSDFMPEAVESQLLRIYSRLLNLNE